MKMEMLFSVLPSKGNQIVWKEKQEQRERIFAFLQLTRYVLFCGQKMEMAFKVVKVERIEAWWLGNYSSGRMA